MHIEVVGPGASEAGVEQTLPKQVACLIVAPYTPLRRNEVRALGFARSIPPRTGDMKHERARRRWRSAHKARFEELRDQITVATCEGDEPEIRVSLVYRPGNYNLLTRSGRMSPFACEIRDLIAALMGWRRRNVLFVVSIAFEERRIMGGDATHRAASHHRSAYRRRAA